METELLHGALLVLIGMGAGFVQRVSGFGLGIFAMLFLPHFMAVPTAAASISTLFSCATTSYNALRYRKQVHYKTALPMICAALVTIPVAVAFSAKVSVRVFQMLLGGVLILLSLYFLFFNASIRIRATFGGGLLAGALSGVLGGLFSTGGPPAVLYLSSATRDKMAYFATIQFYFCVTNLYSIANRILGGQITGQVLLYGAIGIAGCMAGDLIGKAVFDKLDPQKLKTIIYLGMILSGIVMFF